MQLRCERPPGGDIERERGGREVAARHLAGVRGEGGRPRPWSPRSTTRGNLGASRWCKREGEKEKQKEKEKEKERSVGEETLKFGIYIRSLWYLLNLVELDWF